MKKITLIFLLSILTINLFAPKGNTDKFLLSGVILASYMLAIQQKQAYNFFKEMLACRESNDNWKSINSIGYLGLYQFGRAALEKVGFYRVNCRKFKEDPAIFPIDSQNIAFDRLVDSNLYELGSRINLYLEKSIRGVKITKSGIIAACHLGGVEGVKNYFKNGIDRKDLYKTSISDYLVEFSGYDF
jgi:hypothetical protein